VAGDAAGTENKLPERVKRSKATSTSNATDATRSRRTRITMDTQPMNSNELLQEINDSFEAFTWEHVARIKGQEGCADIHRNVLLSELVDWKSLKDCLSSLGFNIDNEEKDAMLTLGLQSDPQSYTPSLDGLVRSRLCTLRTFTCNESTKQMAELDRKFIRDLYESVDGIEGLAKKQLATMRRERQKEMGPPIPPWQEPSLELAAFIDNTAKELSNKGAKAASLLFLSNVQEIDEAAFNSQTHTLSAKLTRETYVKIYGNNELADILQERQLNTVFMWSPSENSELDILHRKLSYARKKGVVANFYILVPFDALPCSWEMATPFIRNPFSASKWSSYLTKSMLLEGATRCVFSGAIGPLYQLRNIAIYKLQSVVDVTGNASPYEGVSVVQWRKEIASIDEYPHIIVDFAAEDAKTIEYVLTATEIQGLIGWSSPINSRGSNSSMRRRQMQGFFATGTSAIHLLTAIRLLRSLDSLQTCCIGTSFLFNDPNALIANLADSRAITAVLHLTEQSVLINSKTALITTDRPAGLWCPEITEKAKVHRFLTVKSVKERDGRTFAMP
jgi:hypothetical protein